MEKSKLVSFLQRLIVTIILVPAVIYCIVKGYTTTYLLALLGAALLSWEWSSMVTNKRPAFYAITYFFVAVTAIVLGSPVAFLFSMVVALALAFWKSRN